MYVPITIDDILSADSRRMSFRCSILQPNSYSRVVVVNGEHKILIFANRALHPGEEITYDYKFPFEEESIPCGCGALDCIGRMN